MLPRSARLTSPDNFARTTKSGFRVTSKSLIGYLYLTKRAMPAQCGLIISKNIGGSVVRHRLARQIRHSLCEHLNELPTGALLVVRVLPGAVTADIRSDLSTVISKLIQKTLVAR